MTSDLGGLLRRALHAEAAQVRTSPDALNLIRARTSPIPNQGVPMTTLDEAAQHVVSACQLEDSRLAALRGDEQRISNDIDQTTRRLADLNTLLAEKRREVKAQEAVAKKASDLADLMRELGITAEPIPPMQPADYRPSAIEAEARAAVPGQKVAGPGNLGDTQAMAALKAAGRQS
jgi:hypothetical protein